MIFRTLFLSGAVAASLAAQTTFVGATATQAALQRPAGGKCTLEVSESPTFRPLVPAVDPALFAGADQDNETIRLIGKRAAAPALNRKRVSMALQAATKHYWRRTCGTAVETGSFTTATIPLGMTYADVPKPENIPTHDGNRNEKIIDPFTGALLRHVSLIGDINGGAFTGAGAFNRMCRNTMEGPGPGYLCALYNAKGNYGGLYYIIPSTGAVRFLGFVNLPYPSVDNVDGKIYYGYNGPQGADPQTVVRKTYTGNYSGVADGEAASVSDETFINRPLGTLMNAFDRTFDPGKFGCNFQARGQYALLQCAAGYQDTYGWLGILDMGNRKPMGKCGPDPAKCPHIIAAHPTYRAGGRLGWCGLHNIQLIDGQPLVEMTLHGLMGGGKPGQVGLGPFETTLTAPISASDTVIHVAGRPVSVGAPDANLQNAAVNDIITIADGSGAEGAKITAISGLDWTVTRGIDYRGAMPHGSRAGVRMACNAQAFNSGWNSAYWKFLEDPHGSDTTNLHTVVDEFWPTGGHDDWGPTVRLTEGYKGVLGPILENLNKRLNWSLDSSPLFAGVRGKAYGTTVTAHPSFHQVPPADQSSFLDFLVWQGGNLISPNPGAVLVSGQLYKLLFNDYVPPFTHRRKLATIAITQQTFLTDVSGPSSLLGDSSRDSYKYCVAEIAGECRRGSAASDVYVNAPGITHLYCSSGSSGGPVKDICVAPMPAYASAVVQLGFTANSAGEPARGGDNGAGYSRALTYGLTPLRDGSSYASGKSLPDGSWALFPATWDYTVWMVKIPPYVRDGVDRSTFVPALVKLNPGRAINAEIEFWYDEHGGKGCTSRNDPCRAVTATVSENNPFYFASEPHTAMPCPGACAIAIPVLPGHVAHWRTLYSDGPGKVFPGESGIAVERAVASSGAVILPPPPAAAKLTQPETNAVRAEALAQAAHSPARNSNSPRMAIRR